MQDSTIVLDSAARIIRTVYLHNTITEWLIALAVLVGALTVMFAARAILTKRLAGLAGRTSTDFDDLGVDLVRRTRAYFLVALALHAAAQPLTLPRAVTAGTWLLVVLTTLFQLAVWGNGLIGFWIRRYSARRELDGSHRMLLGVGGFIARVILWAVIVLLALDNLGMDVTALIAGLGVGGIAVALAVQNILGDLFAALSIIVDKPFVVGDFVVVGDVTGTVEDIGLKTTRIRSLSGEQIVVANSDMLGSRIRNFQRLHERRIAFTIGVTYETPRAKLDAIPDIIREIVSAQPKARFDRAHFARFAESSLDFDTVYFVLVPDYLVYMDTQQAINLALFSRFESEGIEFAYPTRTLKVSGRLDGNLTAVDTGGR